MPFELLVLDLDGVVLDSGMRIDQALEAGVRRAVGRGLRVTLATGRMPQGARPYWERLQISTPLILYNGALVWDAAAGAALYTRTLAPGLPWETYPLYANAPVEPLFFSGDSVFCLEKSNSVVTYCKEQALEAVEVGDRAAFLRDGSFVKCLFIGHPATLAVLREEMAPAVGTARLVLSRSNYLELLPAGASKGEALRFLAGHLGIPIERVIAVGDQENDLEMIRAAGLGVAMPDSPPHVRAAAARVAPSQAAGGLAVLLAEVCPDHFRSE